MKLDFPRVKSFEEYWDMDHSHYLDKNIAGAEDIAKHVFEYHEFVIDVLRCRLLEAKEKQINPSKIVEAYENEISNQATDHAFDFDNVLKELFGDKV